ncbi:MAG: ABC transporter permease, partial [Intestinibacter sp.]
IKKMLTFEGLYYAGITIFMIMTIGMGVMYIISKFIKNMVDYAEFVFPASSLILLIVLILLVYTIAPRVVYKQSSKSSVTERLRRIEQ